MTVGRHVFGKNRLGLWAIENVSLTDKLEHILPRVRVPLPNLTDVFLPANASTVAKSVVRQNGFYAHVYLVANQTPAADLAKAGLEARKRLGTGALEFDLEGSALTDATMKVYATDLVGTIRKTHPNLAIRLNVPPYKGYCIPVKLINEDPELFVIAQAYHGNMDGRLSESDVLLDLLRYGIYEAKAKIHYAVMAGNPRRLVLPEPTYKPLTEGSVYDDDLLMDAGLI
jgi:hypothetical protein